MSAPRHHQSGRAASGPCNHVVAARPVEPYSSGCQECLDRGDGWDELWVCLSCGWVACSNASPNQHAKAHYQETDHPVAVRLEGGTRTRWCFVHQRTVG
jgi:uncharacterized UBP type Zn finger protein